MRADRRCLGKAPAVRDPSVLVLRKGLVKAEPIPDDINWWAAVGDWPMFLNDVRSCCVQAAGAHAIQQRTAYLGYPVVLSDQAVEGWYSRTAGYIPGRPETDRGTLASFFMGDWERNGIVLPDGTVDRLAGRLVVNHRSIDWLRYAIWKFGSVMLGVNLPKASLDAEFIMDQVGGEYAGGHEMLLVGALHTARGYLFDTISWGGRFRATESFILANADEAEAILDKDFMDARGLDPAGFDWETIEAEAAYLRARGGSTIT